ncbi:MAG: hypothetical protein CSYNP_04300 [Syntrophus sp. SKADARSKE-3]|nr:hypothetical protein [Syntrophus sp. SKADARSKE-3]
MDQKTADKAWRDLQDRIEQMLPRFLSGEVQHLEYKPGSPVLLLPMSSDRGRNSGQAVG